LSINIEHQLISANEKIKFMKVDGSTCKTHSAHALEKEEALLLLKP
jgi:hypothetical protein